MIPQIKNTKTTFLVMLTLSNPTLINKILAKNIVISVSPKLKVRISNTMRRPNNEYLTDLDSLLIKVESNIQAIMVTAIIKFRIKTKRCWIALT